MPRYRRLRGGYEALELGRPRDLPPDPDELRLLQYGSGIEAELQSRPGRERGPAAYGEPMRRGLLEAAGVNLGRSVEFAIAAAVNTASQNILNLVGDDKEARVITVTMFAELINAIAGHFINEAYAVVDWGSGGVRYSAEVDFGRGTVFQVCASSLRLDARASGSGTIRCGAHVGYGSTAKSMQAQRTMPLASGLAIAGTSDVTIPNFVNELRVQRRPANSDFLIQFFRPMSSAPFVELDVPAGTPEAGPFRIPSDASVMRIVNGGVAMNSLSRIFGLAL